MTLLSVECLTTAFRRRGQWTEVVKNVNFDVYAKETVAIVGESGSGKSVTALSIMRLLPEKSSRITGQINFDGTDLAKLTDKQMQHIRGNEIAMIFQEPMTSLNPVMSIGRQIAESIKRHRGLSTTDAAKEAIGLLDRVHIPTARARYNEYPHQLSGGMLQRVMIAMALACQPKLLIADEPTTALDVTIQAQILELIKELQLQDNMAVLFITHDMGVVAEVADRTVVMFRSQVLETATTQQIFAAPQHNYTKALLAAVPQLGSMRGTHLPAAFPIVDMHTGMVEPARVIKDRIARDDETILDVQNLVTRFDISSGLFGRIQGRVHAVENVSFTLQAGETLALVGESGCGKSTTGRAILRLVQPTSGTIRVEGVDIHSLDTAALSRQRRRMQMIFQDPFSSLNPRMRVRDALAEPLLSHGLANGREARDQVNELLYRVGLQPELAHRYPHEFSGGQRQRICIARALTLNPRLIVADEAVSALDVSIKAQVINLMLELQQQLDIAYLFISHDMAVVERVAHRVAVMYLGEIVEIGPREAVFRDPQHPYTRRLLDAVPIANPEKIRKRRLIGADEIKSPIRSANYIPPERSYFEPTPGHLVQQW